MAATAQARDLEKKTSAERPDAGERLRLILSLGLAVVVLGFYNPVAHNRFVFFDDSVYLIKNNSIHGGLSWATIRWAFTTFYAANWHPLTWLSHALDCQMFGLNPAGHHYVSLMFHAGNAVLVFLALEAATGLVWPSWIVAAIFGVHPLTVESVAWAAERKNVLSMFFCLLALYLYTKHARKGRTGAHKLSVLCFALALMAKPQVISLPIILLLWDYWPMGRIRFEKSELQSSGEEMAERASGFVSFRALVMEKLPFLVLSVLSAVVTIIAQRAGNTVRNLTEVPVWVRLENCAVSYVKYLENMAWPVKLAPMYPHPGNSLTPRHVALAALVLAGITGVAAWQRRRRYLAMGWLWFLIALVPMIGLVQVGEQAMADRYLYLSMVGLLVAIVWSCRALVLRLHLPPAVWAGAAAAIVIALGLATHHQLGYWRDGETLWRYTLSVTDRNYMAHDNLAMVLAEQGRADEAIQEFRAAEGLHQYPAAEIISLGSYEQGHGHLSGAIEQYLLAASISNDRATKVAALDRAAYVQALTGDMNQTAQTFEKALAVKADDPNALAGSGVLARREGNPEIAVRRLTQLARVAPSDVSLLLLAAALRQAGRDEDAAQVEREAQKVSANYAQAQESARAFAMQFGVKQ